MNALEQLKEAAETTHRESVLMSRAYAKTLSALRPVNFILVVGAALLSLVAGASMLTQNRILSEREVGILALVSGALTIVHSKLGCEEYQAECKKLMSFHRGMAVDYENLCVVDDVDTLRNRFSALNDQLSAMIKSSTAFPYEWIEKRIRKRTLISK